jgi:hypothetical protein
MAFPMKGWECPRCEAINAPHVSQCSCKPATVAPFPFVGPLLPPMAPPLPAPEPWPTWPPGTVIGYVAPPDCPTSLGDVWAGETRTEPGMLADFASRTAAAPAPIVSVIAYGNECRWREGIS